MAAAYRVDLDAYDYELWLTTLKHWRLVETLEECKAGPRVIEFSEKEQETIRKMARDAAAGSRARSPSLPMILRQQERHEEARRATMAMAASAPDSSESSGSIAVSREYPVEGDPRVSVCVKLEVKPDQMREMTIYLAGASEDRDVYAGVEVLLADGQQECAAFSAGGMAALRFRVPLPPAALPPVVQLLLVTRSEERRTVSLR
jgi:hypothetical protein